MDTETPTGLHDLLLARRGLAFVSSTGGPLPVASVRAVALELAELGFVPSARLQARLATTSLDELVAFRAWARATLLAVVGGQHAHEPLFRRFPEGVPSDTAALWWRKVLVHFLQAEDQPCLCCRRLGTTHVLDPCQHVVCDHCFDGANYSACPVCEHHVDRGSPFFQPTPERGPPAERVHFKLIDLGESLPDAAQALFLSLCERPQALSPADRDALTLMLGAFGPRALAWLPPVIPLRENVAIVFGTLFKACDAAVVLPVARRYMTTATDVLRFIAVLSGTDGSLQRETVFRAIGHDVAPSPFWSRLAGFFGVPPPAPERVVVSVPRQVARFRTAKLSRPLRRALLGVLEGLDPERLTEDMLRHRAYWVWVGEFLHPHEYASRYPQVARAFQVVRGRAPDGTPAPAFEGWNARLERALGRRDMAALLAILAERPGEFARRLDHVLRLAGGDAERAPVVAAFAKGVPRLATPLLVTLRHHFPARVARAAGRVYWPKGRQARGVAGPDARAPLPAATVARVCGAIDTELLRRFATKPAFATGLIDAALRDVPVPFNERTASRAAVALPRGARVPVPEGPRVRLFLHWCEPRAEPGQAAQPTDLDLSIGLYDADWHYLGVCSYYQLQARSESGALLAQSAGDLRDAPWPDGATEFVDLDRAPALAAGVRYAVMVVNSYAGLPFSRLERAFAGVMLRDDPGGQYFDPRTVALKFALDGENGVYLPLVLDLRDNVLHWLDVYARGGFALNTVATSNTAITRVCPALMTYFASGVRASMLDLGLLHLAARCARVLVRGPQGLAEYVRRPGETAEDFHARLVRGQADGPVAAAPAPGAQGAPPLLALLYRGDLDLPEGSQAFALFRDRVTPELAASDLL